MKSEEKMYEEIMFLQQNKFKETQMYKAQKFEDNQTIGYVLTLINGLAELLKENIAYFCIYGKIIFFMEIFK